MTEKVDSNEQREVQMERKERRVKAAGKTGKLKQVYCQVMDFWDRTVCLVGTNVLEQLAASIFKVLGGVFCLEDGGYSLFRNVGASST